MTLPQPLTAGVPKIETYRSWGYGVGRPLHCSVTGTRLRIEDRHQNIEDTA
jgi:hypothetical protein